MTALDTYTRLEAEGRYFDGQSAQPLAVVVGFGERSLVIMSHDETPIAHWPLASLRAVSLRRDSTIQLVPYDDSDERLVLSDKVMLEAIRRVCPGLYKRRKDGRGIRRAFVWACGAGMSLLLIVFVLMPALAAQLAILIPPEREQQLGDAVIDQMQSFFELATGKRPEVCNHGAGQAALDRMAERLTADLELPYPLRVGVVDHSMVNAFAVPGGRIIFMEGLIKAADTPEEVAGVLAHEIGHVVNRDPTREALRAAGTAGIFGLLLGDFFGAGAAVAAGEAVLKASYQREAETKADETAYGLLADAELPTKPFAGFFRKMEEEHGEMDGVLGLLASHPGLGLRAERAAAADKIGDGPFEPAITDQEWVALRGICQDGLPAVRHRGKLKKN